MATTSIKLTNPPLNEVVFHVVFPELQKFGQPHMGIFWSQLRDSFPVIQKAPRLFSKSEPNEFSAVFPDNRLWLIHEQVNELIQLQDDRFLFNWRKTGESDVYPGFDKLYPAFKGYLDQFFQFLDGEDSRPESITGFELHYVNHMYEEVWTNWGNFGELLPAIDWQRNPQKLPDLRSVRFYADFNVLDFGGNLNVTIESKLHQKRGNFLSFEIKVSAYDLEANLESLDDYFLPAHKQIKKAFASMITTNAKDSWDKS